MKFIKWKILAITSFVCLLPMLFGLSLWNVLPDTMAIHFDFYGNPDNFASKACVVFGLPVMMFFIQILCCIVFDRQSLRFGENKKPVLVMKWLIPVMTVVLHIVTLGYGLGWSIDIRKVVAFLVGGMYIVIGNYLPKFNYVKHYKLETQKARKINRFAGVMLVVLGVLFVVSIFLPPIATVICLVLMILCTISGVIYGIKVAKN